MATNGQKLASANETQSGAREQLLEAASEIMREGDTIDLSLSELSLRAGLNSALVKYYFGNKNGLMLALLDRDMGKIVIDLNALVAKDMPPEEKLRRHISGVIDTYYTFPYLNRLMMRMVRDAAPIEAARIAERYLKPLSAAIVAEQHQPEIKSGNLRKAAEPLLCLAGQAGVVEHIDDLACLAQSGRRGKAVRGDLLRR